MFPFTPRYIKHGKLLRKGVTRFLDYKRDLLSPEKLEEITVLRAELDAAIKARDAAKIDALSTKINSVCERSLPSAAPSWIADNVEVLFVAIVIALGIRAYIATLFQIPTGSMQPTLNGITAVATAEDPSPGLFRSMLGRLTGERFVNAVSDHTGVLRDYQPLTEHKILLFMPYCKLHFRDGHTINIKAPKRQLLGELQLDRHLNAQAVDFGDDTPDRRQIFDLPGGIPVSKGQVLARGIVRNCDFVLVDKIAYHFRKPRRGEVFVFTTNNIDGIRVPREQGAQHYIKRLAGVPGDHLQVRAPLLYINGQVAQEPGFQRVMSGTPEDPAEGGYKGYSNTVGRIHDITLPPMRYFAMGDNSYNSSDSRDWGPVPQRNLVGPAFLCYFPFSSHWGLIR